jgi:hypothetical protein
MGGHDDSDDWRSVMSRWHDVCSRSLSMLYSIHGAPEHQELVPQPCRILAAPRWSVLEAARRATRVLAYRDLLATLSRHGLTVRYEQSLLGGA